MGFLIPKHFENGGWVYTLERESDFEVEGDTGTEKDGRLDATTAPSLKIHTEALPSPVASVALSPEPLFEMPVQPANAIWDEAA